MDSRHIEAVDTPANTRRALYVSRTSTRILDTRRHRVGRFESRVHGTCRAQCITQIPADIPAGTEDMTSEGAGTVFWRRKRPPGRVCAGGRKDSHGRSRVASRLETADSSSVGIGARLCLSARSGLNGRVPAVSRAYFVPAVYIVDNTSLDVFGPLLRARVSPESPLPAPLLPLTRTAPTSPHPRRRVRRYFPDRTFAYGRSSELPEIVPRRAPRRLQPAPAAGSPSSALPPRTATRRPAPVAHTPTCSPNEIYFLSMYMRTARYIARPPSPRPPSPPVRRALAPIAGPVDLYARQSVSTSVIRYLAENTHLGRSQQASGTNAPSAPPAPQGWGPGVASQANLREIGRGGRSAPLMRAHVC